MCHCQGLPALLKHAHVFCVLLVWMCKVGGASVMWRAHVSWNAAKGFAGQRGASEWPRCSLASVYIGATVKTVGRQQHQQVLHRLNTQACQSALAHGMVLLCRGFVAVFLWCDLVAQQPRVGRRCDDWGARGVFVVRSVMALTCHTTPRELNHCGVLALKCACKCALQLLHCCSNHVGSTHIVCLYAALLPLLRK
jgi:hypothetical protein